MAFKLPNIDAGGMLDDIKSRLGMQPAAQDEYYDDYQGGYAEEYPEEYAPGYEDEYADGYGDYGDYDDRYAPTNEPSLGRSLGSGRNREISAPRLVSIEDVRARTQSPEGIARDSASSRKSSLGGMSRVTSEERPSFQVTYGEGADQRASRSEGLDSLFQPSEQQPEEIVAGARAQSGYDPYAAYAGTGAGTHKPRRSLSILKPAGYEEVESIAKVLKMGDVAVLCLRNTPDQLSKRILDFSFGVACYAEARVDCVADKVFVVCRGEELSDDELNQLYRQGVL